MSWKIWIWSFKKHSLKKIIGGSLMIGYSTSEKSGDKIIRWDLMVSLCAHISADTKCSNWFFFCLCVCVLIMFCPSLDPVQWLENGTPRPNSLGIPFQRLIDFAVRKHFPDSVLNFRYLISSQYLTIKPLILPLKWLDFHDASIFQIAVKYRNWT